MKRVLFLLVLTTFLFGCDSVDVKTGPSVGLGPVEVGLYVNPKGEFELEGSISIPIVGNKDLGAGINWDVAFSKVLNEAKEEENYLIVLWEENGSIKQQNFSIGQPFKINFEHDQWVRRIERLENGSIVVFVEKQELAQQVSPVEVPDVQKQAPSTQESVKASMPTGSELNNTPSIWNINNIPALDLPEPGRRSYKVSVNASDKLLWPYYWCTSTEEVLQDNLRYFSLDFLINGNKVSDSVIYQYADGNSNWKCANWVTTLSQWKRGDVIQLDVRYTFSGDVYDGYKTYPAGKYTFSLTVSVK